MSGANSWCWSEHFGPQSHGAHMFGSRESNTVGFNTSPSSQCSHCVAQAAGGLKPEGQLWSDSSSHLRCRSVDVTGPSYEPHNEWLCDTKTVDFYVRLEMGILHVLQDGWGNALDDGNQECWWHFVLLSPFPHSSCTFYVSVKYLTRHIKSLLSQDNMANGS